MEKKPPYCMTPFDRQVTTDLLQTIKLLLPYMPPHFQRMAGTYAKFSELQNAIYYFQPPYFDSRRGRLRQKKGSFAEMMEELTPFLPEEIQNTMENISGMMEMMEMVNSMAEQPDNEMTEMVKQMFSSQERMDGDERMDGASDIEKSGSGQEGTDSDGRQADQRKNREESGSGYDDSDYGRESERNSVYQRRDVSDSGDTEGWEKPGGTDAD